MPSKTSSAASSSAAKCPRGADCLGWFQPPGRDNWCKCNRKHPKSWSSSKRPCSRGVKCMGWFQLPGQTAWRKCDNNHPTSWSASKRPCSRGVECTGWFQQPDQTAWRKCDNSHPDSWSASKRPCSRGDECTGWYRASNDHHWSECKNSHASDWYALERPCDRWSICPGMYDARGGRKVECNRRHPEDWIPPSETSATAAWLRKLAFIDPDEMITDELLLSRLETMLRFTKVREPVPMHGVIHDISTWIPRTLELLRDQALIESSTLTDNMLQQAFVGLNDAFENEN